MTVIDLTTRTETSNGITCETCRRTLEPDWVVFTGRRWLCGQCLGSEAYDTGFREACKRLGVDVIDAVLADPDPSRFVDTRSAGAKDSAGPEVRVFHHADGWTLPSSESPEPCHKTWNGERRDTSLCSATAVWKVVEQHPMHLTISFWCDSDLAAEHHHLAQRANV